MAIKETGLVYSTGFSLHETGRIFLNGSAIELQLKGKRFSDPFYTLESLRFYQSLPFGANHPERGERVELIFGALEAAGLVEEFNLVQPQAASLELLETTHSPEYIASVRQLANSGGGFLGEGTLVGDGSYEAACLAVGSGITAAAKIISGDLSSALVLTRPPGHHARREKAAGFCIFNNAAVTANYWLNHNPGDRILILDWDVHHGDGTQSFFYNDNRVFYFSMHQYGPPDLYPGTGSFDEIGAGPGEGYTVNVPLPGKAGDKLYLSVFEELVGSIVQKFQPNLIIVSAGQDGHFNDLSNIYLWDPEGGMSLTAQCYHTLAEMVRFFADKYAGGNYIVLLEGGYDLRNLSNSMVNLACGMLGLPPLLVESMPKNLLVVNEGANKIIDKVRQFSEGRVW